MIYIFFWLFVCFVFLFCLSVFHYYYFWAVEEAAKSLKRHVAHWWNEKRGTETPLGGSRGVAGTGGLRQGRGTSPRRRLALGFHFRILFGLCARFSSFSTSIFHFCMKMLIIRGSPSFPILITQSASRSLEGGPLIVISVEKQLWRGFRESGIESDICRCLWRN